MTDYLDGTDRIDVSAYDFTSFADMLTKATLSAVAGGVRIDFDTGDAVTLTLPYSSKSAGKVACA